MTDTTYLSKNWLMETIKWYYVTQKTAGIGRNEKEGSRKERATSCNMSKCQSPMFQEFATHALIQRAFILNL